MTTDEWRRLWWCGIPNWYLQSTTELNLVWLGVYNHIIIYWESSLDHFANIMYDISYYQICIIYMLVCYQGPPSTKNRRLLTSTKLIFEYKRKRIGFFYNFDTNRKLPTQYYAQHCCWIFTKNKLQYLLWWLYAVFTSL